MYASYSITFKDTTLVFHWIYGSSPDTARRQHLNRRGSNSEQLKFPAGPVVKFVRPPRNAAASAARRTPADFFFFFFIARVPQVTAGVSRAERCYTTTGDYGRHATYAVENRFLMLFKYSIFIILYKYTLPRLFTPARSSVYTYYYYINR